jgi:hypothetical protein
LNSLWRHELGTLQTCPTPPGSQREHSCNGGWVDLPQPFTVKAGQGFIAVPTTHRLTLTVLRDTYAICNLDADATVPAWATGRFFSVTRTAEELSVVCLQSLVPDGNPADGIWGYVKYGRLPTYTPPDLDVLRNTVTTELDRLQKEEELLRSFIRHTKLPLVV